MACVVDGLDHVRQVGDTGSTVVEESQTLGDEVDFTEGLTMDRGFLSPYFINDQERSLCEMKKPKVKNVFDTPERVLMMPR